ncbi:cytochrome P450 [Martensiomyces pterosporus]|nr:cytochrome P450 [Martensiomyces pterosporus]
MAIATVEGLVATSLIAPALTLAAIALVTRALYRSFFSPISKIPGPFLNSMTNIPLMYHVITGQYHMYVRSLHAKYGEVVRIGHDQVSLSNTADTRLVLATHAFRKAPTYTKAVVFAPSTFSTTDPELNKVRRRQLGNGFAMHTIKALEDLVLEHGVISLSKSWDVQLEETKQDGGSSTLVNYFYGFHGVGFDVIGSLGFGQSFNVIPEGNMEIADHVQKLLKLLSIRGLFPFFKRIQWRIQWVAPQLSHSHDYVTDFVNDAIARRRKMIEETGKPPRVDILQKFIDAHDPVTNEKLDEASLTSEIILLLVAGTDTTSNTLSWTVMYLMHYPEVYNRLRREIRSKFPDLSVPIRYADAKNEVPYLTAVIYESMRMNPSVSGRLPRTVPTEGITLQGYHIPSSVQLCMSFAACHRNEKTWPHPNKFDPERFMGPDSEERQRDVMVFSSGVRVCVGRNLAWVELYTTLANLIRKYDFELPGDAPYGPHVVHTEKEFESTPVDVPGAAFTTCGPKTPKLDCWIRISHAQQ